MSDTDGPSQRVVRVQPDVAGIDRAFDYLVPSSLAAEVRVGTVVRVELHGRRVGGWVVEDEVEPPPGVVLKPIAKVTGWGPTAEVVELTSWASWRWAGRRRALLGAATAPGAVPELPGPPPRPSVAPSPVASPAGELAARVLATSDAAATDGTASAHVVRLPPATDPFDVVMAAAVRGPSLVVAPTQAVASDLATRLRRAGLPAAVVPRSWAQARRGGTCVLGARGAAWAPVPRVAAVVVLDEHDEVHQDERAPTWHARDVAVERARRLGVPALLVSPMPSSEAQAYGPVHALSRAEERAGWPAVEVIDRRDDDPLWGGLLSPRLTEVLRGDGRVVCVLNRKGRSRLLACIGCGAVAGCEACQAAVVQEPGGALVCGRCSTRRPPLCLSCHRSAFKNLRAGVSRVREELEALARRPVAEVTGDGAVGVDVDGAPIVIGTEAVLHRVRRADVVVVLDLDQELLAPRYRAAEEALALLVRAARLLGGRRQGGRLVLQTRLPEHEVVQAVVLGDPARVGEAEARRRAVLRYPPAVALAEISGPSADAFVAALGEPLGLEVRGPVEGRWLVRAPDHGVLCDALAAVRRPPGRLRISVDPMRL